MKEQEKRDIRKRIVASFAVSHATKEAESLLEKAEKEEVANLIDVYFDALDKQAKDEVIDEVRELEAYMIQDEIKAELLRRRTSAFQQLQNIDANIPILFFQSRPPSEAREFLKWYLYERIKAKSIPHYGGLGIGNAPYQKDQTPAEVWLFFTTNIERPLQLDYKLRYYKEYLEPKPQLTAKEQREPRPQAKPIQADFSDYLTHYGKQYYPHILKQYEGNTKPQNIIYLIIALHELGWLTEDPTSGNQTALFKVLELTFQKVGRRQNLNNQLAKYFAELEQPRNTLRAKIEAVKQVLKN